MNPKGGHHDLKSNCIQSVVSHGHVSFCLWKSISGFHTSYSFYNSWFDQTGKVSVLDTYGKVPLSFEANEGQVPREVQFLARGNGYSLFFAATELQLELRRPAATALPYKMHSVPTALHRNGSRHFEHAILHMQLIDLAEVTHSINQSATELIPEDRARQLFNALWPELEKQLIAIPAEPPTEKTYATGT